MKKLLLAFCVAAMTGSYAVAEEFETEGDGKTYSFATLAEIDGSNVTKDADGTFIVSGDFTITDGDSFNLDEGVTIKLADGVRISLEGATVMDGGQARTLITSASETDLPKGFWTEGDEALTVKNVDFEYVAISVHNSTPDESVNTFENCTFTKANGALTSIGAINVGATGSYYLVKNCKFSECVVPAIGEGANILTGLTIEDCEFVDNNTENSNKPQINITVGGDQDVIIRNCTLTGTGRTKVGGIAVSNLLVAAGTNKVLVEGCRISEHRYGITATGPLYIEVRDNVLLNNNHDPNPMTGGSGISLAGYGYGQDGIISGNHIEGHLWGITLIQCRDINCGQVDNADSPGNNVFKDNGNSGNAYDLYNNGANTVYAQNNTWSVPEQTEAEIEKVIFHKKDDAKLGEVIFMPAKDENGVEAIVDDANGGVTEFYNLQGIRLNQRPASGLYIQRNGDKAVKAVAVR